MTIVFTPDHWHRLPQELQTDEGLHSLVARAEGLTLRRYRQRGTVRLKGYPDDPAVTAALIATIADVAAFLFDRPSGIQSERVGQRQTVYDTSRSLPATLFARLDRFDERVPFHMGV